MVEITDFIEIDKVTDNDMLNGPPAYEDVVNQTPENTRYIKREKQRDLIYKLNSFKTMILISKYNVIAQFT